MEIVFVASLLVAYIIAFCIKNKTVPASLSAAVYDMPTVCTWAWTICMSLITAVGGPFLIAHVSNIALVFAIVSCVGMLTLSFNPQDKMKTPLGLKVHNIEARVTAVSSQAILLVDKPELLLTWIPWVIAYWIMRAFGHEWERKTLAAELICFGTIIAFCMSFL